MGKLSTTAMHHKGMVSGLLPGFPGLLASKFADINPMNYHVGCHVVGLSLAPSKTQVHHRTQRSIAGDLGQPAIGTVQQGCYKLHIRLKRCTEAGGGHFEHSE